LYDLGFAHGEHQALKPFEVKKTAGQRLDDLIRWFRRSAIALVIGLVIGFILGVIVGFFGR